MSKEGKQSNLAKRVRAGFFARYIFTGVMSVTFAVLFAFATHPALDWLYRVIPKQDETPLNQRLELATAAAALLGAIVGAGLASLLGRFAYKWDEMDSGEKVTLFLGIFAGLVASVPFLFLFNAIFQGFWIPFSMLVLTLGFMTLSSYALKSMDEILPWTKGRGKTRRRGIKVLDTSVIIDGRIYDVLRTQFLEGQLYVPGFVLEELQYIADSADPLRRQRGRRGLEILRHMQSEYQLETRVHDRLAPDMGDEVDARLVSLARAMGADLVTNDHNLNQVAKLQDVRVLNMNELALSLRPNVLPGELLRNLPISKEGNQVGQGVGYLEDGTMVVVEHGKNHIGDTIDVTVTQVIQTERGKMIFAELPQDDGSSWDALPKRRAPRK